METLQELSLRRDLESIKHAINIQLLVDWEEKISEYLADWDIGIASLNWDPQSVEDEQEIFELKRQTVATLVRRVTIDINRELHVELALIYAKNLIMHSPEDLKELIKAKSSQLGFVLAGVTTPDPPPHLSTFENWLAQGRHGSMEYLATEHSRSRRADPRQILPDCKSILVLATPYSPSPYRGEGPGERGQIAAYAQGEDYHDVLPARMQELVQFIEGQVGSPIRNRWYTDSGPLLERDLAQRAGLGWIGKNTCLIHPRHGSYFLLSEILLDLELEPDLPMTTDHCGTCTRCIEACPTDCILPDRTIDAGRCISFLTIELKGDIPEDLRGKIGNWVFGCDVCQQVCPWNRFAEEGDPAFGGDHSVPPLNDELLISKQEFNQRFKKSPIKRAKRRGYLRNVAVAIGNTGNLHALPVLQNVLTDEEPMVREHAKWAIKEISKKA
jgi:epoxyqueuosine reductase